MNDIDENECENIELINISFKQVGFIKKNPDTLCTELFHVRKKKICD